VQKKQRVVQFVMQEVGFVLPAYQVGISIPIYVIRHAQVGLIQMEIYASAAQVSILLAQNVTAQQTVSNVAQDSLKKINVLFHAQQNISKIQIISAPV